MATPIRLAVLLKPDDAQPALDRAAQYARVNPEIEVVAIRIVNNYKDSEIEQLRSKENAKFESLKRLYSSIEKFSFKVLFDKDVADTFTDECRNGSYSIAVISANKRHTIRDIFISSIDSSIMRNSTIPLLVVRSASQTATLGQNVLLAIDFNEVAHLDKLDDYLFEAASQFAKSFDSKVHLANCVTPQSSGLMGGNLDQSKIINNTGVLNPVGLHNKLALEFANKHGIDKDNIHVLEGRIDEEIPRLCEALNARMVCMGTTPRSTFLGSINSSASELVLEQIKGDIFIVNSNTFN